MCGHQFKKINDVSVCIRCGLTIANKKIFFDKSLVNRIRGEKGDKKM